ncbi:hypothetical protein [Pseudonocardia sp. GCM10023141]|uniref:hypothetical protein n=1 Tax=Pseudonocardia sp. GCM10023141 TaxID=3252653 RepID=UPI003617447B
MNTAAKLLSFSTALTLVFLAALWAGTLTAGSGGLALPATIADKHTAALGPDAGLKMETAGLVATAAGFTLVPRGPTTFVPGVPAELAFVVTGLGGRAVTGFDVVNEQLLDVVVVRRDGTRFQRLEPVLGPGGVWRAPMTLPAAGVYRAYADFVPVGGPELVLGIDLSVSGDFVPEVLRPTRVAQVDGYTVRLDTDLVAGSRSEVFVAIDHDRLPVTDVERRHGTLGQLVVLRQSDLSSLRVAPAPAVAAAAHGPGLAFTVEIPAAGMHRLFLEFQHEGVVHTAEFTVQTGSDQ